MSKADQVVPPDEVSSYGELFEQPEFKQWFGNREAEECDPHVLDVETGLPKIYYHGTSRSFDEFADSSITVSNQGIDHIDNLATFFFEDRAPAESYALNQERELVATVTHVAKVFGLKTWQEGIAKWNELISSVFEVGGNRERVNIFDGVIRFDGEIIGLDTEYAGFFGEEDLKDGDGVGIKPLIPHIAESARPCEISDVQVPS